LFWQGVVAEELEGDEEEKRPGETAEPLILVVTWHHVKGSDTGAGFREGLALMRVGEEGGEFVGKPAEVRLGEWAGLEKLAEGVCGK